MSEAELPPLLPKLKTIETAIIALEDANAMITKGYLTVQGARYLFPMCVWTKIKGDLK